MNGRNSSGYTRRNESRPVLESRCKCFVIIPTVQRLTCEAFCTASLCREASANNGNVGKTADFRHLRRCWCPEELDRWAAKRLISQSNHRLANSPRTSIARSGFVEKAGREWTGGSSPSGRRAGWAHVRNRTTNFGQISGWATPMSVILQHEGRP